MKPKLCYVLPKYDVNTEEHFYHNYRFLEDLARDVEIFLIIERSVGHPIFKNVRGVYTQKTVRFIPLRALEVAVLFVYMRLKGVKNFYVHYSYFGGIIGSVICKLTGGKLYYWHCVSVLYRVSWSFRLNDLLHKIKAEIPLKLTLKMIDYLVTGTKSVGDFYHKTFDVPEKKMVFIPNEVDLDRFDPKKFDRRRIREQLGIADNEKMVLFVHRIAERKGAHHIPIIAKRVCDQISNATFVIAGGGPYFETLKKKIAELGLNSKVKLLGWVPNREIMDLYAAGDVFIMPSEEEGFPRVLLECMAMGVPFVATDIGGVRDISTKLQQHFVVTVGDNASLSSMVIELLEKDELRKELRKEGLESIRNFSLPRIKEEFIERILDGKEN